MLNSSDFEWVYLRPQDVERGYKYSRKWNIILIIYILTFNTRDRDYNFIYEHKISEKHISELIKTDWAYYVYDSMQWNLLHGTCFKINVHVYEWMSEEHVWSF